LFWGVLIHDRKIHGVDNHAPSIDSARQAADAAGVTDRVTFEVASDTHYPGSGYDLIAFFDCLHDRGDPIGAMRHARETLAPDGTVLIVEPMAGESVEENFNPVGVVYSAASVLVCTPNALSTDHGTAPGTVASEAKRREVPTASGFTHFRRAMQTPSTGFRGSSVIP
jgi:hypothetical protein